MADSMRTNPRFLLIFAHPDDEAFIAAGLICRYRAAGASFSLVSATRGDAGGLGEPPLCTRETLPERREDELRQSAALLRIHHIHILDYQDKRLADASLSKIRGELVGIICTYRPHIVITFDSDGMNGHPDHIAISRFTMDAVSVARDPRRLPGSVRPYSVQRVLWTSPVAPWETTQPVDLRTEPGVDFLLDVSAYKDVKAAALKLHQTQHVPITRCFFSKNDVHNILSVETFRQAHGPALDQVPCEDVLTGINLER